MSEPATLWQFVLSESCLISLCVSIPSFIPPCLPSYATEVPIGPAWVYEIKHDGYRFMLRKSGDEVQAFTRNGHDWTPRIPTIVEAVRTLPAKSAVIDGECVICDAKGIADFKALRGALGTRQGARSVPLRL